MEPVIALKILSSRSKHKNAKLIVRINFMVILLPENVKPAFLRAQPATLH